MAVLAFVVLFSLLFGGYLFSASSLGFRLSIILKQRIAEVLENTATEKPNGNLKTYEYNR